jgi:hypothetical protein
MQDLEVLPHVTFFNGNVFSSADIRRSIVGISGELNIPVMQIKQIKVITFTSQAIKEGLVVGNHKHYGKSGQWEIIIVLDEDRNSELFHFRYRNYNSTIQERKLYAGDVVAVPPGCSLGLVSVAENATLIEISNQEYRASNYIPDMLFES